MCACEGFWVCEKCLAQWPLDYDPYYLSDREIEQERAERAKGEVSFRTPLTGEAA